MAAADGAREINLAIVGSGGVGKSCMTVQYVSQEWDYDETYDPTIEDTWRKKVSIDGSMIMLSILDTAGQDEYAALVRDAMKNADGVILVFDLTNPGSLKKLDDFLTQLYRAKDEEFDVLINDTSFNRTGTKFRSAMPPMVLAGNKCDLPRKISTEEAQEYAKNILNLNDGYKELIASGEVDPKQIPQPKKKGDVVQVGIPYFETSAKTRTNIDQCFEEAIRQTLRWKKYLEQRAAEEGSGEVACSAAGAGVSGSSADAAPKKKKGILSGLFKKKDKSKS